MDYNQLFQAALNAAFEGAKGHAADLKEYIEARAKLLAESAVNIERDLRDGAINDDDVRFAWQEIKKTEKTMANAVDMTLKLAAQDAVNAALSIVGNALRAATGLPFR